MHSQRCHDLLHAISLYLDREASQAMCDELERHMADCPDCRAVLNTLEKTLTLYRTSRPSEPLPDPVRRRLREHLGLGDPDPRPGAGTV